MTEALIALVALSLMEIVLGIDNIVFITVATGKLPPEQQSAGRRLGLLVALGTRILLLCGIYWIAQLVTPVLTISNVVPVAERLQTYFYEDVRIYDDELSTGDDTSEKNELSAGELKADEPAFALGGAERRSVFDRHAWEEFDEVSIRDLILIFGGLFLIYSSVREIHHEVEEVDEFEDAKRRKSVSFTSVITQVALMDVIFSLDSVITAVGMAEELWVMVSAVVLAVLVMILFANQVGDFVSNNPSIRMLALSFLLLIGVMLCAEGIGTPISKGYIYFAMAFSLGVEFFNMRVRKKKPVAQKT